MTGAKKYYAKAMLALSCLSAGSVFAGSELEKSFHFPAGAPSELLVHDGYAYILNTWSRGDGVLVFDVRDPANPVFAGGADGKGYLPAGVFCGDTFFAVNSFALAVFDAAAPANLRLKRNLLFSFPYFDARSLAQAGNRLFVGGQAGGLRVFDLAEPAAPVFAGWHPEYGKIKYLSAQGNRLAINMHGGQTALVEFVGAGMEERARFKGHGRPMLLEKALIEADGRKVWIHDTSAFEQPALATNLPAAILLGMAGKDELATVSAKNILEMWDVSNPLQPALLRRSKLPEEFNLGSTAFWRDRLHVLDRAKVSLNILDVSCEDARVLSSAPIHRNAGVFELGKDHVFQAFAEGNNLTMLVFSLNSSGLAQYVAHVCLGPTTTGGSFGVADVFRACAIRRVGDFLLAGNGVADVSNPLKPLAAKPMTRAAAAIAVDGSLACLAQGDLVSLQDISNLPATVELGVYRAENGERHYTDVAICNGLVCAVNAAKANPRVEIIDIHDPAEPKLLGQCAVPSGIVCAWVGNVIYVPGMSGGDGVAGMVLLDVSNPSAPRVLQAIPDLVKSSCYRIMAHGKRLFYTDGMLGIQVADIGDPLNPAWKQSVCGPGGQSMSYTDFEIRDNRLYGLRYSNLDVWRLEDD